jgi:uncharacterized protein (DUF58 family)
MIKSSTKNIKTSFEVITRRIVFLLFAISIFLAITTGGVLFLRISYVWGIVFFSSWLWISGASRGLNIHRTTRASRAQVGQIFEEQVDVLNSSRFPLFWLEIRDESPIPGAQGAYVFNFIRGRNIRSFLLRTRLYQRGVYQLGPVSLTYGDIFGLFRGTRNIPVHTTLIVYPPLFDITDFPSPPGLLSGGEALRKQTHQITPNAAGVREYYPGDPLNRIHWLSTVRRNRLMVKEFELDPLADVWLFIDSESSAHAALPKERVREVEEDFWDWLPLLEVPAFTEPVISTELRGGSIKIGLPPSTEEYSVSISASLARYFLKLGRAVGLASLARNLTLLPPDRSGRQLGKILESLALLKADGSLPMSTWAETEARHLSRGSIVVLITPSAKPDIAYLVDRLNHMGLRPVLILLDASSFGNPSAVEDIFSQVKSLGIPVYRVARGDNLGSVLSTGPEKYLSKYKMQSN